MAPREDFPPSASAPTCLVARDAAVARRSVAGIRRGNFPVQTSVQVAQGTLHDAAHLRLSPEQREVPVQALGTAQARRLDLRARPRPQLEHRCFGGPAVPAGVWRRCARAADPGRAPGRGGIRRRLAGGQDALRASAGRVAAIRRVRPGNRRRRPERHVGHRRARRCLSTGRRSGHRFRQAWALGGADSSYRHSAPHHGIRGAAHRHGRRAKHQVVGEIQRARTGSGAPRTRHRIQLGVQSRKFSLDLGFRHRQLVVWRIPCGQRFGRAEADRRVIRRERRTDFDRPSGTRAVVRARRWRTPDAG